MLKLLIVDDEPGVCELLLQLIDFEALSLVCVGVAYHALDADNAITLQRPDIVITDIHLPGMTGLELIEKHQGPQQPNFIVISGYREFEYAQKALKFGVEDYLLKPINGEDLNRILSQLGEKIRLHRQKDIQERELLDELYERNAILRTNELRYLFTDPTHTLETGFFHFGEGEFFALILHAGARSREEIHAEAGETMLYNICARIRDNLTPDCFDVEYAVISPYAYILVNYSPERHAAYREKRDTLQILLHEACVQYEHARISMGMGDSVPIQRLHEAVRTAECCIGLRLFYGPNRVIDYARYEKLPSVAFDFILTKYDHQKLARAFAALRADELTRFVDEKLATFEHGGCREICRLYAYAGGLFTLSRAAVEDVDPGHPKGEHPLFFEHIAAETDNCVSVQELKELLHLYLKREVAHLAELRSRQAIEPIYIAKEYVQKNISRQISLEEVAELAFVSPGYFSVLFKKKTGMTFSDYIIGRRMEAAKELLRGNELSIAEIAQQVGYTDARHFSKLFHKASGVNPAVYRKFYQR